MFIVYLPTAITVYCLKQNSDNFVLNMKKIWQSGLVFFIFLFSEAVILPTIPIHLRQCYQSRRPYLGAPKRLDVFLSFLRRLERETSLDMRLLCTTVLRSLRLDGITEARDARESEFILPYRASAFQYNRYKLLMNIFLPSQDLVNVDEILAQEEKCLLHGMLSSSVQPWERGDESIVCPVSVQQRQTVMPQSANRINSRCPIEDGIIQTDWGTVSPGTVVAAVAASLEAQRISMVEILNTNIFKEDVSQSLMEHAMEEWGAGVETMDVVTVDTDTDADIGNIWVATLAGDLAEVVVNQGPRAGLKQLTVGSNNRWNDTLLPRQYYIFPQNQSIPDWHFTDAEILAGIDGVILAHHVPKWVEVRRSLRLSQIVEMYYSDAGVSFDPTVRACNRHSLFSSILNTTTLLEETFKFANILSLHQITVYIPKEEMRKFSEAAVTTFLDYVPQVLRLYHRDCRPTRPLSPMDLVVATDSTLKGYEVEQFISFVGGAIEVDAKRSTIALLQGNTGQWIVPPSNNITSFFTGLNNMSTEWPDRLNLPNVISRVNAHCRNRTIREIEEMESAGRSTVVLVLSPTDRPSSADLDRARELMSSLRTSFFDVYFAYASQDVTDFQNINNEYLDYSEIFVKVPSNTLSDIISAVETHLLNSVIPSRIMGGQCTVNGTVYQQVPYGDHIIPGRENYYRIHPYYLTQQSSITVQFRNDGQGQILVCMWRGAETNRKCQALTERTIYDFNLTDPCPSPDFCPPANFMVSAMATSNLCAHMDCRLPHQVDYYVRHSGLRCLPLLGSAARMSPYSKAHLTLSLIISMLYYRQVLFYV